MKNLLFILLSIFCLNSFGQTHTINDTTVTRYLRAKSGSKLYLMHPLVFSDNSEQQSGVTNTLFSNWNSAYNLSHAHSNLSLLSAIKPQDTTRWGSGGSGTVISVSITTANGISGTVANATTTPAITILPDTVNKYKTHAQAISDTIKLHNEIIVKQNKINITLSDATSSSQTITLPDATLHNNDIYFVKKIDNSANTVTVQTTSSQTIDGNTSLVLSYQYSSLTIISNGTNWFIISII